MPATLRTTVTAPPPEPAPRPQISSTDAAALGSLVLVAIVAVASLALAHLHHHSLPAVLLLALAATAVLLVVVRRSRLRVVPDRGGAVGLAIAAVLAIGLCYPGFGYGVTDKDPGGYVAHSVQIARHGSYDFTDEALAHPTLPVEMNGPGSRLPGFWTQDLDSGRIVPQFFHLWPALLATAYDVAGFGGITAMPPLMALLALWVLVALARRVSGMQAGVLVALLAGTNMLQVWHGRYPTTEVLAEALFTGSLLAVVVAVQTRWLPAAVLTGLLVDVAFLNRADGWLLVMLSVAGLCAAWVLRADRRLVGGVAAGLAGLAPYSLWQAYGPARSYTVANDVPDLRPTLLLVAVAVAAALVLRPLLGRAVGPVVAEVERRQWAIGFAVCALAAVAMVVGFLRPALFGPSYFDYNGRVIRSFDEQSLIRLSWFLTLPGMALMGLGLAVVALRRWSLALWLAVLPTLLIFPVFAVHAKNSTRLMWWSRRYVSYVLPGVWLLIALALAFALGWVWRGRMPLRLPAGVVAAGLVAVFLHQSLPLRSHDEFGGSFGVSARLAALSGTARGVYLWQPSPYCCAAPTSLWASAVWLERGQLSVLLPHDASRDADYVAAYKAAFPDRPLFVLWNGTNGLDASGRPAGLSGLTEVDRVQGSLPQWDESDVARPSKPHRVPYDLHVFRVR